MARKSIAQSIRASGSDGPYTLTERDIGRPLSIGEGFGSVLPGDVGKRCWMRSYGLVMENAEQRDARKLPRFGGAK
jgi:hypothetical protein